MKSKSLYPTPAQASLSVIIPVYNSEKWIGITLEKLWASLSKTTWKKLEIIIIDDGSTDKTLQTIADTKIGKTVKVVSQKNAGRFLARKKGLDEALGEYVFFIDSRVFTDARAFTYLVAQIEKNPDALIWNGHVEVERKGNSYARFWQTVTFIAWRKYMAKPKLTHYGLAEFDYYPKGTTCLFAPRDLFLRAYDQFKTSYKDLGNANDDSSLIRYMAHEHDIYISPDFSFTYNSRSTLKAFIKHTEHRGIVFVDGFLKKGTRYRFPLIAYYLLAPIALLALVVWPYLLLLIIPALLALWLVVMAFGVPVDDASAFVIILPLFSLFYSVGLYRGLYLKIKASIE